MPSGPNPADASLDLVVLSHLRGFPQDLRRYSNLIKHAHPQGKSAVAIMIQRPGSGFLRRLCELVASGEDVVTTMEAAELIGVPAETLLARLQAGTLPKPLYHAGVRVIWSRAALVQWLRGTSP